MDCDSSHEQLNEIIQLLRKQVNVVGMELPDNSCLHEEGGIAQTAAEFKMNKPNEKAKFLIVPLCPILRYGRCTLVP